MVKGVNLFSGIDRKLLCLKIYFESLSEKTNGPLERAIRFKTL
ncbi:MAG: hypothetical protein JETT_2936 [Candidatus Jettenia ecosi]|uniref:Uncharacterized protein n=1 Tax=Candidatus Jettenia ecosi TaxID=2494326 RepID=A0A533QJR4_9BACT|nr:MAG: hypothetical protein JETT_2936 [Candidatus Jettenia ecosi]